MFYLDVSQCCNTVNITSTGFANTFHSAKLGVYIADGLSNGRLSYKNYEGAYLYFAPSNTWMVSIGIHLKILILKKNLAWKHKMKDYKSTFDLDIQEARYYVWISCVWLWQGMSSRLYWSLENIQRYWRLYTKLSLAIRYNRKRRLLRLVLYTSLYALLMCCSLCIIMTLYNLVT